MTRIHHNHLSYSSDSSQHSHGSGGSERGGEPGHEWIMVGSRKVYENKLSEGPGLVDGKSARVTCSWGGGSLTAHCNPTDAYTINVNGVIL